jgi:hypothetical protein
MHAQHVPAALQGVNDTQFIDPATGEVLGSGKGS